MPFGWLKGRSGRLPTRRVPIICRRHDLDLRALRQFVDDGRPDIDQQAPILIENGECPACRYRAADAVVETARREDQTNCSCCGSVWSIDDHGWVAVVGPGLEPVDTDLVPLPEGVTIDGESFEIQALDPQRSVASILRAELAGAELGIGLDQRIDDVVDDLIEGVEAASEGKADEGAEVYRSVTEGRLDAMSAQALETKALSILAEIHRLLDGATPGLVVSDDRFDEFVRDAIDSLPPEFLSELRNVAITVRSHRADRDVYGTYSGIELTRRRAPFDHLDVITIYQDDITEDCESEEAVRALVRETVLHEVGHYFGIGDDRLRELGY